MTTFRTCIDCDTSFTARSWNALRCPSCRYTIKLARRRDRQRALRPPRTCQDCDTSLDDRGSRATRCRPCQRRRRRRLKLQRYHERKQTDRDFRHRHRQYARRSRRRRMRNPEYRAEVNRRNRDRPRLWPGLTASDVTKVLRAQGSRCAICSTKLTTSFHRDHVLPRAKGGPSTLENLQLLCPGCNLRKSDRMSFTLPNGQGVLSI